MQLRKNKKEKTILILDIGEWLKDCSYYLRRSKSHLIGKFLDVIGTQDFITTMGGGVHSHPMGTKAGATAVLQAYEAWKQKVPLEEYAQDKRN